METQIASLARHLPEQVFHSGDEFFETLLNALAGARQSIDFESYIFEDDELGRRVAEVLKNAAAKGVKVRLLVDGVGSPQFHSAFLARLLASGVECRIYHPFPWKLLWTPVSRIRSVRVFFTLLGKINRRNHRKVCVIDGAFAWVGSMNVSACHLSEVVGASAWRDTGVRIQGERISELQAAFEHAWREAWQFEKRRNWISGKIKRWWTYRRHKLHPLVRLNDTRARREKIYVDLITRMHNAEKRIWIINAYFVPRSGLVRALCAAARHGADVKVILPSECDIFFIPWISAAYYSELLSAGVKIHEYKNRMCHAKTIIIDHWVTVGSTNLNHRSLLYDLEVDVVLTSEQARMSVIEQFGHDIDHSREVSLADWKKRSWFERFICRITLLIRHWV